MDPDLIGVAISSRRMVLDPHADELLGRGHPFLAPDRIASYPERHRLDSGQAERDRIDLEVVSRRAIALGPDGRRLTPVQDRSPPSRLEGEVDAHVLGKCSMTFQAVRTDRVPRGP
jgi:hypothetical protein